MANELIKCNIHFNLAVWFRLYPCLVTVANGSRGAHFIFPSRKLNPVATNDFSVYHESNLWSRNTCCVCQDKLFYQYTWYTYLGSAVCFQNQRILVLSSLFFLWCIKFFNFSSKKSSISFSVSSKRTQSRSRGARGTMSEHGQCSYITGETLHSAPSCDHFGRHGQWKKYLATKMLTKVANWWPTDYNRNLLGKLIDVWSYYQK